MVRMKHYLRSCSYHHQCRGMLNPHGQEMTTYIDMHMYSLVPDPTLEEGKSLVQLMTRG